MTKYIKTVKGYRITYYPRYNSYGVANKKESIFTSATTDGVNVSWDFMSDINLPNEVQSTIINHYNKED